MPVYRNFLAALSAVALIVIFVGCGVRNGKDDKIVIAEQFGLAYAPLQVLKARGDLDDAPDGVRVEWVKTANAAVIREAMAAGRMDIGFMGIPPFLIGSDGGMDWRIFCGLSRSPLGLVTLSPGITSLADFTPRHRIALPQPGSIQHILLSMQAEGELGDPTALDHLLVTMSHPDGMGALLSGTEITAHFTSPPFLMTELAAPGSTLITSGEEAFGGPFTFIAGVVHGPALETHAEFLPFFLEKLEEACRFLTEEPADAAALLEDVYDIPEDELLSLITAEGTFYGTEVLGVQRFGDFMHRAGYLKNPPDMTGAVYSP